MNVNVLETRELGISEETLVILRFLIAEFVTNAACDGTRIL